MDSQEKRDQELMMEWGFAENTGDVVQAEQEEEPDNPD
jgi:hypothetical protein